MNVIDTWIHSWERSCASIVTNCLPETNLCARSLQWAAFGELPINEAKKRKLKIQKKKNTNTLELLLNIVTVGTEPLVLSEFKSLYTYVKEIFVCEFSHNLYRETLKKPEQRHSKNDMWNFDIQCSSSQWQSASAYSCSHSSTVGAFKLGVVWPPYLQLWSRSEPLPTNYLPEELVEITALRQKWKVDGRCQNEADLFDTGIKSAPNSAVCPPRNSLSIYT
jgi:hypothetical protein